MARLRFLGCEQKYPGKMRISYTKVICKKPTKAEDLQIGFAVFEIAETRL